MHDRGRKRQKGGGEDPLRTYRLCKRRGKIILATRIATYKGGDPAVLVYVIVLFYFSSVVCVANSNLEFWGADVR